jgi:hypothetical protein
VTNPVLFDVRTMLDNGLDPFSAIQEKWAALEAGGILAVCASFEPRPLMAYFSSQGVQVRPGATLPGECWVFFGPKPC